MIFRVKKGNVMLFVVVQIFLWPLVTFGGVILASWFLEVSRISIIAAMFGATVASVALVYRYACKRMLFSSKYLQVNTIFQSRQINYSDIKRWKFNPYDIDEGDLNHGWRLTLYLHNEKKYSIKISDLQNNEKISDTLKQYMGDR